MSLEGCGGDAAQVQHVAMGVGDFSVGPHRRDGVVSDERRQIRRRVCIAEIAEVGDAELEHIIVRSRAHDALGATALLCTAWKFRGASLAGSSGLVDMSNLR